MPPLVPRDRLTTETTADLLVPSAGPAQYGRAGSASGNRAAVEFATPVDPSAAGLFNTVRQVGAVAVTGAVLAGLESSPALVFGVVAAAGAVAAGRLPVDSVADREARSMNPA
ncbi:hypothetical protein H074_21784 [Amycolatopsis decaplanina DSM 44594]|uniref:Uncharacterized protein n=1 Tax=Amycolatopsis decaplanina DSM 44594 TaxID=1284240 RepID=M2Y5Q8_9PSEU|nr:hypothetical protein H074_21784 [Amycolatopsis decaplanina DSM 44594]